jgi:hypothetical protein
MPRMVDRAVSVVPPPMRAGGGAPNVPYQRGPRPWPQDSGSPERAALEREQREESARGRWIERLFRFQQPEIGPVSPAGGPTPTVSRQVQVTSSRSNFARIVAMRGGIKAVSPGPLSPLDLANIRVRLQINGDEDLITSGGQGGGTSDEYDALFSTSAAPWFWFAAPARVRFGDLIIATWVNDNPLVGGNTIVPYLTLRLVDDAWWREVYGD